MIIFTPIAGQFAGRHIQLFARALSTRYHHKLARQQPPSTSAMQLQQKSLNEAIRHNFAQYPNKPTLMLESYTWYKENHGLYDYQATQNNLSLSRTFITSNCKIYRHPIKSTIEVVDKDEQAPAMEYVYVATVIYDEQRKTYQIQSADVSGELPHHFIAQEEKDYYRNSHIVVAGLQKDVGEEGYSLEVGNFVRFGKLEFEVIEINDLTGTRRTKQSSHLKGSKSTYVVEPQGQLKGTCKFCLCEETDATDPLIAPCNCRGSCAVVHVQCLRSWINSKVKQEAGEQAITYNFSKFECEICKAVFPMVVRLPDRTELPMLNYQKASGPYIILESCNSQANPFDRVVYMLLPSENHPVKLGRGHNCPIRMEDITVSRVHAQVRLSQGKFYIMDMKSKFGTLVKFREELALRDKLKLQSGRTLLSFSLLKCGSITSAHSSHQSPFRRQARRKLIPTKQERLHQ